MVTENGHSFFVSHRRMHEKLFGRQPMSPANSPAVKYGVTSLFLCFLHGLFTKNWN